MFKNAHVILKSPFQTQFRFAKFKQTNLSEKNYIRQNLVKFKQLFFTRMAGNLKFHVRFDRWPDRRVLLPWNQLCMLLMMVASSSSPAFLI